MMRVGFCRGRPRGLGMRTSATVASARLTSLGEALSSRTPIGRPLPSTSTIHFVPLPRLVCRLRSPFFRRGEAAVKEGLVPLEQTSLIQRSQQRAPCMQPDALLLPLLQSPPARGGRRKLVGQKSPRRPSLQNPEDTFQAGSIRRRRSPSLIPPPLRLGKQRLNQLPLLISQQLLPRLHG